VVGRRKSFFEAVSAVSGGQTYMVSRPLLFNLGGRAHLHLALDLRKGEVLGNLYIISGRRELGAASRLSHTFLL
jgi:hypothetical protein